MKRMTVEIGEKRKERSVLYRKPRGELCLDFGSAIITTHERLGLKCAPSCDATITMTCKGLLKVRYPPSSMD